MASQRHVNVGGVQVGGGAPVVVQTMTKTETANLTATMDQIRRVADAGADLVRVAVPRDKDIEALNTIVRRVADPRDRRHPLQPHAGAEGDRRRRALRAPEPGQHRRARQGRRGRRAGERQGRADAHRRELRLAAQAPARARARELRRGARDRRRRVRGADGAAAIHRLQGLDQVDQRAQHDRREPAAVRADPVPAAPRHHRGRARSGRARSRAPSGSARCSPTGSATRSGSRSPPSTRRRRSRSPGRSSRRSSCASAARS